MLEVSSSVLELKGVGPELAKKLDKLAIRTIHDLLLHVPFRYDDLSKRTTIAELRPDEEVTVLATVSKLTQIRSRQGRAMIKGTLEDDSGKVDVLWFNQPYLLYSLRSGSRRAFSGTPKLFKGKLSFINPITEELKQEKGLHTGRLVPVYPETAELSSRTLRTLLHQTLTEISVPEPHPTPFLSRYHLPTLQETFWHLHFPENPEQATNGKRRLAFDEVFGLLGEARKKKEQRKKRKALHRLSMETEWQREFLKLLPFAPSPSQTQALFDMALDLVQPYPADRLIQGEVGSGKTVLAAFACFCAARNGRNAVVLAPTQILAKQHFETLSGFLTPAGIRVHLLVAGAEPPSTTEQGIVYAGTHAVFGHIPELQPAVAVVDEEHRFGVKQREAFWRGRAHPHLFTMTATPIPRTAAHTILADRDVTVLEEIPEKKKRIKTRVVSQSKRENAYAWIEDKLQQRIQTFVVCPFIGESDQETLQSVKAAETEFQTLQHRFASFKLGLLHGKTPKEARERILEAFANGTLDLLVSTPVVEVGIDIPNAGIMVIENAERFGLAQLHQLRGRVGRRGQHAYCFLFAGQPEAEERLKPLETLDNGNDLAELDLRRRGAGELLGTRQSGWHGLRFASWFDQTLIRECKTALDTTSAPASES